MNQETVQPYLIHLVRDDRRVQQHQQPRVCQRSGPDEPPYPRQRVHGFHHRTSLARCGSIGGVPIPDTIHHIRLTVADIARSRAFYDSVFGWPVLLEIPDDADDAIRSRLGFLYGGVIYRAGNFLIGLRPVGNDRFDEDRVGLDHLAFAVPDRADLDAAAQELDRLGVPHEEVKDIGPNYILEFRDPDNIALELVAPKPELDSAE